MGLSVTIKPGHSFTIGANKIMNAGLKPIDLVIDGPDRVERDDYRHKPPAKEPEKTL